MYEGGGGGVEQEPVIPAHTLDSKGFEGSTRINRHLLSSLTGSRGLAENRLGRMGGGYGRMG